MLISLLVKEITIQGARVNNLKSVSLKIPINKITCFAGPSGSGKTSLAFHTLLTESKRRFLNSFPTYLKFFSDRPAPVDVDLIEPVLPAFGLPQNNPVVGSRGFVADNMHLTELFQNLFANFSIQLCPIHLAPLEITELEKLVSELVTDFKDEDIIYILVKKSDFIEHFKDAPFPNRSYDSNKMKMHDFDQNDEYWEVIRTKKKNVGALSPKLKEYFVKNITLYLRQIDSSLISVKNLTKFKCPECDYTSKVRFPLAMFSPYNALGACKSCNGFGSILSYDEDKLLDLNLSINEGGVKLLSYQRFDGLINDLKKECKKYNISLNEPLANLPLNFKKILYEGVGKWCGLNDIFSYLDSKKYKASVRIFLRGIQKEETCKECHGTRLNQQVHHHYIFKKSELNYQNIWQYRISELLDVFTKNKSSLIVANDSSQKLAKDIENILTIANRIGLGHLNINRKTKSVSAGEYQRLLLLKHLAYEGTGALFVFDEPSLGLSPLEMQGLLDAFNKLIDTGNTIVLVEHAEFFHKNCDKLIIMGPAAGENGGEIVYEGPFINDNFVIDKSLVFKKEIDVNRRKWIKLKNPKIYGQSYSDIKIPRSELTWVYGKSGSGKSAVFINTLANQLALDSDNPILTNPVGHFSKLDYGEIFRNVIVIDSQLSRFSSRSSVGTISGLFTIIRKHFLNTPAAKSMGLKDGHLSSNSELGQCPSCEGRGVKIVEMQFLEDIVLECEDCHGKKIKPIYASLTDGQMTVHEAYTLPLSKVIPRIKLTPKYLRIWHLMQQLKLDYLSLDRSLVTLSGGERQRLYLLSKLESEITESFILFENISFGLSKFELSSIAKFLNQLVAMNNTVVIIDQDEFFNNLATFKVEL
jgi:excinuclease ABC subunit A